MREAAQEQGERNKLFNLKLLPILHELLRLRSVTRAAAALNMSQSAVSDALSRLRQVFDDELLIPSGRGFALSDRAQALEPVLSDALLHIEILLDACEFDPGKAQGRVHIAASDYVALTLGTLLVRKVREVAPHLHIQFHDANDESMGALAIGHLDFILMPEETLTQTPSGIEKAFLFDDALVLATGKSADELPSPSQQDWSGPDITIGTTALPPGPSHPAITQQVGDGTRETIVLPAFMLLPFVAARTDIITVVQRRLAERLAPAANTKTLTPSFHLPKVRIFAAWKRSRVNDPLHRWLLGLIRDIGANLKDASV